MAESKTTSVGDLLSDTFSRIQDKGRPVLIYLAIFVLIGTVTGYGDIELGFVDDPFSPTQA